MNWYLSIKQAMPLDPKGYSMHGNEGVHRLREHSGYEEVLDHRTGKVRAVKRPISPQKQKEVDELYSGVHATLSAEIAAVYANNNARPEDPAVIIGFTSDEQWLPDVDISHGTPEPDDLRSELVREVPEINQLVQQPYNPEVAQDVFERVASYDNFMDDGGEYGNDLLTDITRSSQSFDISQMAKFCQHYYGQQAVEHFWNDIAVPLATGGGLDPRVLAYMISQMRFMNPIPEPQIVSIGTTERFSTEYAENDPIDPDEWDEEDGDMPELDESNRPIMGDDGRRNIYNDGDFFSPRIKWIWENPQHAGNTRVFYHGTTKSRAMRALPALANIIQQIQ